MTEVANRQSMVFRFVLTLAFIFSSAGLTVIAQSAENDSTMIEFSTWGSFRGHFAYYNEELEIQENASRMGLELSVFHKNIRFFGGAELAINLFRSPQIFNTDANTNSGFITLEDIQNQQVFVTRLGYLGIEFGNYGKVTIGKQWSVYYDITGYTDKFNVFGGQGSATYVAASDGGNSGTGRAAQTVSYRNQIGKFMIGFQASLRTTDTDQVFDGYGVSLQYEVLDGLKLGGAFNKSYISSALTDRTLGADGDPEYLAIGLAYNSKLWDLGIVAVNQTNGDLTETLVEEELIAAVFNARGLELFIKFKRPLFSVLAGYNGYFPDVSGLPVDTDFETNYFVFGAEFKPVQLITIYSEYRLSNGTNQFGFEETDVMTLGIKIDLQRRFTTYIKRSN